MIKQKTLILNYVIIILLIIMFNFISMQIANALSIPFFLDTWATALGTMVAGLWVGIIGGILYNAFMALSGIWEIQSILFALCSIWVAIGTYWFYKKKWIDPAKPIKLIAAGFFIGIINAIIVIAILSYLGKVSYDPALETYASMLKITGSPFCAMVIEKMITEMSDKLISVFLAALVLEHIPKKFRK
jgi:hypothetical protein